MGRSPGLGSPDPASLEMQTLYCKFLHFENTYAFPHPTSQLVNPRCPLNNPEQFSHTNLVCQINALIIKIVMQSEACVFQSYPINRLSLGQGYTPHIAAKYQEEYNNPQMTPMQVIIHDTRDQRKWGPHTLHRADIVLKS